MDKFLNKKFLFKYKIFLLSVFVFPLLFPISVTAQANNTEVNNKSFFIILMFDKSRSLDIENGNTKYALPAAKYLVEFIDVYQQKTGIDIRLAFIPFGESVEKVEELNSVSKENILKEIRIGKAQQTDFIPPFRKSMHLFASSMKSKCLIFLFTDGVPDLQDSSESMVLNYFNTSGIKEDIRILTDIMNVNIEIIGFNDRRYGLKVTRDGNPYFIKNIWDSLLEGNSGSFHSIGYEMLDPIKVVHQILEKFFYVQFTSIDWIELKKGEFVIDLEPFLEGAVCTLIKEGKDDTVTIKNSKGEELISDAKGKDGRYLIYYLSPPFDEKLIIKYISDENAWFKINKKISPVMKTEKEIEGKTGFNPYIWVPVIVVVLLVIGLFVYGYRKGKLPFFKREKDKKRDLNKNINEIKNRFSIKREIIIEKLNKKTSKSIKEAMNILKKSWVLFDDIETSLSDKFGSIPEIYNKLIEALKYANYDDEKIFGYIIRTTTDAPVTFLDGFSNYLNDIRWKGSPFGDIIKDIYLLVERPTPPRRILNSIIRKLEDEEIKEILILMRGTYDLSLDHSGYTLHEILKNFVDAYNRVRERDEIGRIGYELFVSLEKMYEMIDHSPYHEMIEMPEIPEGAIRSWRMTSKICKLDVLNVEPKPEDDPSKVIKKSLKESQDILGPEKQIVDKLLNKWLDELEKVPEQPVKLTFEFLPEIYIDNDRLENDWSFFSIKILNCSRGNAYNFDIELEGEEDNLIDSYTIGKIIKGESAITKLFKVYEPIDNVIISYKFKEYDHESRGYKISSGTIPIKIEDDKKDSLEAKTFIYNRPYTDNSCIFVNRYEALKKLEKNTLKNEKSDIFNIFGIRGIGKTSLIKRFREFHLQNENIKYTYINNINFDKKDIQTIEFFLGILTEEIMREYKNIEEGLEVEERKEISKISSVVPMKRDDFKVVINDLVSLEENLNYRHFIFLDDADIFEEINHSGKYQQLDLLKLLKFLHELIINLDKEKGKIYIIFSGHKDALGDQWSKAGFWPSEKNINLKLLEKTEVLEIASEGGLIFNELSLRYLMNLTGGHPELVQLICAEIREREKNVPKLSKSISMKTISNAVFKISRDPEFQLYFKRNFQYIVGYSLPRSLHHDLLKAVRGMDKETLEFKKELLASNNFTKLVENGFLEFKDNKSAHVRIGILKFLPEDYIIVPDDWYKSHT